MSASRRAFFSTLGKALGAGGLLLPWAGNGALALPADLGSAAHLPVSKVAPTFSAEALRLRELREVMFRVNGKQSATWSACTDEYGPLLTAITDRPKPTWQDVVELAEEIWRVLPKEEIPNANGSDIHTGALSVSPAEWRTGAYHCRHQLVALVEAILTLGHGERRDTRAGFVSKRVRPRLAETH